MKSSVAQEGHFAQAIALCAYYVLGVAALLAHNVCLQTNGNHRQGDLNHYFVMFLFFQKSRTIFNSVMIMIKTEVVCWLCHHEVINP